MATFVSLFRGINVGGKHKVPMSELKALHEALGFKDVISYIQSGNVVFSSDNDDTSQIAQQIEESFKQKFGFHAKVMVRSLAEFSTIVANNPFQNQPLKEPKWQVILFLATRPESTVQEALRQGYAGPEEFYLNGQELYIYYPESIGHSKLPDSFLAKTLKTVGTARNWNTVLKLYELLQR